ncbi:hypothetical protein SH661x_003696 [Planctomicrobium sp. SH661]|uniref:hypothetical protein n=1 Tax=Planctomicrobium sp. SH661 TaxID=3448124 RepID=UPI003F5B5CE1
MPSRPSPRSASNSKKRPQSPGTALSSASGSSLTWRWLAAILVSVGLAWVFWWPLWQGGGLVGGDLYPYYFPQKAVLAESLKSWTIPLWNPLVGFGYPVLGESQTAALYPPNLVFYSLFEINTAYNALQLGHYLLAFFGTFALARRWGLQTAGALLAATAFVYGWFPARICLEWSIIGGAWFVWILWGATAYLQTSERKYLALTAVFLGMDLLAGHYNLAFITLLTLLPFPWMAVPGGVEQNSNLHAAKWSAQRPLRGVGLAIALGVGFLIAAVQLLPSWELKTLSQRKTVNETFAPTYGHLPFEAISQLWMPWRWYAGERSMDELLSASRFLAITAGTNQAEAQLYVGLAPLILMLLGLSCPPLRRLMTLNCRWGWLLVAGVALIFASGWPIYWFPWMPGLNFFRGPGRYSMVAALAFSLLGGSGLDSLLEWRRWKSLHGIVVASSILLLTSVDLWTASRQYSYGIPPYLGRKVFYAVMLDGPPIKFRSESALRSHFEKSLEPVRLYAPGANLPTLLNVSALPVYLGIGPEIYESDAMNVDFQETDPAKIAESVKRLRRFGVTHLLTETPINPEIWDVTPQGTWSDRLLNVALGRTSPYSLYALNRAPGRVSIEPVSTAEADSASGADVTGNLIRSVEIKPNRVRVEVECLTDCRLVLRDLDYPGWKLVNPRQHQERYDDLFRAVTLKAADSTNGVQVVEWVYRPGSVIWGALLSCLGLGGLIVMGRARLPKWFSTAPRPSEEPSPR